MKTSRLCIIVAIIVLFLTSIANSIILHPEGEPGVPIGQRPTDSVTAHVGCCSGVAIAPNYLLSAKHFSISPLIALVFFKL